MATPARQNRTASPNPLTAEPPPRVHHEFDIPETLWPEARTETFGAIRTVALKELTPLEEKTGVSRAKGDALRLAYELSEISLGYVINEDGTRHVVRSHDGSLSQLWGELSQKIRALVMQAYSELAAPTNGEAAVFLKSRRTQV